MGWQAAVTMKIRRHIYRLTLAGRLDTTFTRPPFYGLNYPRFSAIARQADGKIILGDLRLFPNGQVDYSYNPGVGFDMGEPLSLLPLPGQELLAGGTFLVYDRLVQRYLVKIRANGSPDPTFRPSLNGAVRALAGLPSGQFLLGGDFRQVNSRPMTHLVRLYANGDPDTTFNVSLDSAVHALILEPSGAMIIAGRFRSCQGQPRGRLAKLRPDGTLDVGFASGIGANGPIYALLRQPDGKILAAGDFTSYDGVPCGRIVRLLPNGQIDPTFQTGSGFDAAVQTLGLQSDGKVLVGGNFTQYRGLKRRYLVRLESNGSYDFSYATSHAANGPIYALTWGIDSTLWIGGAFSFYFERPAPYLMRLLPEGAPDVRFNPGLAPNAPVHYIAPTPNGHILIAGRFTSYNGRVSGRVARISPTGTLDTTFQAAVGPASAYVCVPLSDGKVLIGGDFTEVEGRSRYGLARLLANGRLDTSFVPPTTALSTVSAMLKLPDEKVIVSIEQAPPSPRLTRLMRFFPTGAVDTNFPPLTFNGAIHALTRQMDGKILVAGSFTRCDSLSYYGIVRLHEDGRIDGTFQPSSGLDGGQRTAYALLIDQNGRYLIAGDFLYYNGALTPRLACLLANGQRDTTFQVGTGADMTVYALALASGERFLMAGAFSSYAGVGRNRIARLYGSGATALPIAMPPAFAVLPNPSSGHFTIQGRAGQAFSLYTPQGHHLRTYTLLEAEATFVENLPSGVYLLREAQTGVCAWLVIQP